MKKFDRMEAFVHELDGEAVGAGLHPCYVGYFTCFNRGDYYEAHDVLEHLWLQDAGSDEAFFRGLIQIAGAFVHLRKQFLAPDHRIDGHRLRPASRLFRLGIKNVKPYPSVHHRLNTAAVLQLCDEYLADLESSGFSVNPWHPDHRPTLNLET